MFVIEVSGEERTVRRHVIIPVIKRKLKVTFNCLTNEIISNSPNYLARKQTFTNLCNGRIFLNKMNYNSVKSTYMSILIN